MVFSRNNPVVLNSKQKLLSVVGCTILFKLVLFLYVNPNSLTYQNNMMLVSDGLGYFNLGNNLLSSGIFSMDNVHIECFRTPGFPIFLSLIFLISKNLLWVVIIQSILVIATQVVLYKLLESLTNARVGLIGATIFGFDPHVNFYSFTLFSETLLLFFLVSTFFFLRKYLLNKLKVELIWFLLFVNILFAIKPIAIVLILPLSYLIIKEMGWVSGFILLLCINLFNIGWSIRNFSFSNIPSVSSVTSHTLLFYDCAYTEHVKTGKDVDKIQLDLLNKSKIAGADIKSDYFHSIEARDLRNCKYYDAISKTYIKENFGLFVYTHLKNSLMCYVNPGSLGIAKWLGWDVNLDSGNLAANPSGVLRFLDGKSIKIVILTIFLLIYSLSIILFAILGFYLFCVNWCRKMSKKDIQFMLMLLMLICVLTFSLGANGNSARFKLPILPFILIFVGIGIESLYEKLTIKRVSEF